LGLQFVNHRKKQGILFAAAPEAGYNPRDKSGAKAMVFN
jgi:hypothetical protein